MVFVIFQPVLFQNAGMTDESLRLATYEAQKLASLNGRYDDSIYKEIEKTLVEKLNYKPEAIKIKGTETLKTRGETLELTVTVPSPVVSVMEMFFPTRKDDYVFSSSIASEYIR